MRSSFSHSSIFEDSELLLHTLFTKFWTILDKKVVDDDLLSNFYIAESLV